MNNTRILVIEDEENIRDIFYEILSTEGYEVLTADDGHIGVILAQELIPDLILCDILMPEFDGYSVVRQLQNNPNTQAIPFIFVTALITTTDIQQGLELGADAYLAKPFTKQKLLDTVFVQLSRGEATPGQPPLRRSSPPVTPQRLPTELRQPLDRINVLSTLLLDNSSCSSEDKTCERLAEIRASSEQVYRLLQDAWRVQARQQSTQRWNEHQVM